MKTGIGDWRNRILRDGFGFAPESRSKELEAADEGKASPASGRRRIASF